MAVRVSRTRIYISHTGHLHTNYREEMSRLQVQHNAMAGRFNETRGCLSHSQGQR